ncbi:hypothetical protein FRB93_003311 [Tulasnella sp. JGI-2019a]|nr:hypothetical protein FRB93_003311 [Tulasnella sp. JGI-2019a]
MTRLTIHIVGALAVLLLSAANAALYPTRPIQSTTFTAGKDELLTWLDDSNPPHVYHLSNLTVQLMINNDELVSTLATDITPTDYAAMVNIPTYIGVNGSGYYLRFVPESGDQAPIYTGKFAITGLDGSASYREADPNDKGQYDIGSKDYAASSTLTYDVAAATVATTTNKNGRTTSSASDFFAAFVTPTSIATFTTPFSLFSNPTPTAATATRVDSANRNAGSARFQRPSTGNGIGTTGMVYLLWPFLMGVAMAL